MAKRGSALRSYRMNKLLFAWYSRHSGAQLFRYALVGVVNNFAGYLVYLLVTYLGATPKITMTLLYGIGAAIGFFGHRNLTFAHSGSLRNTGPLYLVAHLCGYFLNLAILLVFVDKLGYAHQLVQAIAIFVVAIFLFIAFKFFVFADTDASDSDRL